MNTEVRIPTVLGIGVLMAGLVIGTFLVTGNQIFKTRAGTESTPKNIQVANITSSRASIYWQTDQQATGFIQAGPAPSLGLTFRDDRDSASPQPRSIHFVTLTNLAPNTTYYYKISSGSVSFPQGDALSFKTGGEIVPANTPPIIGTVLNSNLQPIDEALITVVIPGAQSLAAVTKVAGNFVLPLAEVYNQEMTAGFPIPEASISAKLTVISSDKYSQVTFLLPFGSTSLPPITLGQDLDLTPKPASPSSALHPADLNGDGVVNTLDRSIVLQNFGKKSAESKKADLNKDGVVDRKDLSIVDQYIPNIVPQ